MKLNDLQTEKLKQMSKETYRLFQRIWGLLPPSSPRDAAMHFFLEAKDAIDFILRENEDANNNQRQD